MVLALLSSLEMFSMEDIMIFTSLLHCLWCTKKMAVSERAATELCFPNILLQRMVGMKGSGWVVEKWKRNLVNAFSQL